MRVVFIIFSFFFLGGLVTQAQESETFSKTKKQQELESLLFFLKHEFVASSTSFNLKGLFHLGGKETWNRYDMLLKTRSILQEYFHSNSEILTQSINEFNLPETYPLNVSLNSSKIYRELNFEPQQIEKYIKLIVKEYIKNIYAK